MAIKWNQVTWYSQAVAIILFVAVFFLGYALGAKRYDPNAGLNASGCERGERCGPEGSY